MSRRGWTTILALAFALVASPAFAQGGTTTATLNGVVTDADGSLVPGATVVLKNVATSETIGPIVTNDRGAYSFPGLAPGSYKVTISLASFKTVEIDVRLTSGSTQTIPTKLEVGKREEIVNVRGSSDILRVDTPTVSTTVTSDFVNTLPRSDRNALNFLIFLPGVTTTGGAQNARDATVVGLPQNTINITIDGVSNSNLLQSTDGFFSLVVPRLDAVEEVTLTTASAGADASGQGAVQIRFVTRSGTNKFETSLYYYLQHRLLNSNSFFNRLNGLDRPQATNYVYGGRVGGPIVLPGFDGRGKAFFFFNQEEVWNPVEVSRNRTIIRQSALDGNFCYGNVGQNCVNLWALATANGQTNVYDPQVKALLESIRAATIGVGTTEELVTTPNTATFRYLQPSTGIRHSPTTNITVNMSPKHRLQGSYYWQRFNTTPDTLNGADPTFPGFPAFGDQSSYRTTASMSLRSTLSAAIVNELRGGWQWSPIGFFVNSSPAMFENQGGFALGLGFGLTNAHPGDANTPSERNTANYTISDQFNWLKGSHSFQFGGDFTRIDDWATNFNNVPGVNFGFFQTSDPANAMFSTTNFPGSSSADRNSARALYALLTGRITAITATARLNEAGTEYIYTGPTLRREYQDDYSFYAQDVWRWKPTLTFTLGARYQYTLPMTPKNSVFTTISTRDSCGPAGFANRTFADGGSRFCNMFNPGVFNDPTATTPAYVQYAKDTKGYNTDFDNIAPNVGIAWRPNVQDGFLRKVLGDPELATINGGYTRSFIRERLDRFLDVYNGNPGQTVPATRSTSTTAFPLVLAGESWPVLYSQKARLGQPNFQRGLAFPIQLGTTGDAFLFHPDIEVPYTDSWNVSLQRAITKDTVAEIRYIGNTNRMAWVDENWNATNMYETGWLTQREGQGSALVGEFQLAMQNLRANVVAGRGPSFAYMGPGTGTNPLPITLAHLSRSTDAGNPAAYTGGLWTNSTFTGALDPFGAAPTTFADNLYLGTSTAVAGGVSTRLFDNAVALGYPSNFWVMNPFLDDINVKTNSTAKPRSNLVILELRRRLSQGLSVRGSYTWQRNYTQQFRDFHLGRLDLRSTGVPHAFQTLWTYDVPVGRGKRFGANMNPWLDGVVGGWTFSGTARFQRQSFVLRNANLNGMTLDEARQALSVIRFTSDPVTGAPLIFNFPEDIYTNTRLAYATDELQPTFYAPGTEPTGPLGIDNPNGGSRRFFSPVGSAECAIIYTGDCGAPELWFNGRWFGEMDFRLAKQFQLPGRARFELSVEVFNATMAKNFPNVTAPGAGANTFRITSTQSDERTAQIVWRVSW